MIKNTDNYFTMEAFDIKKLLEINECDSIINELDNYIFDKLNMPYMHEILSPFFYLKFPKMYQKIKNYIPKGYSIAFDIVFKLEFGQSGLPWHTAISSSKFLKDHKLLVYEL